MVGVGFKASNQGNLLDLSLGYSHNIIFEVPKELKVATAQEKGQNPMITLEGIDKQLLGQVAAKIRGLRKPEPYKGKGVKLCGEVLRRKLVRQLVNKSDCKMANVRIETIIIIIFPAVSEITK